MMIKATIRKWRNRAYRAKVRYVFDHPLYAWFQGRLWPMAGEADGLKIIFCESHNLTDLVSYDTIFDCVTRESSKVQAETWLNLPDLVYEAKGDILIEGGHAMATIARNKFIGQTRGLAHLELSPPLRHYRAAVDKVAYEPALIHFDGFLGKNLFHFTFDALNALLVLNESGAFYKDIPLLVSRSVFEKPYFQYMMSKSPFDALKLRIQEDGETIRTSRLLKAMPSFRPYYNLSKIVSGSKVAKPHRRIFLDRRPAYQRRLSNDKDITDLISRYHFERIYAEDLSYADQCDIFSNTKYLIALHGAGMTNILFGSFPDLKILEMNSSDLPNPCFFWLAQLLGNQYYDIVVGGGFDADWNYSVPKERIEQAIVRLLGAS